MTTNYKTFTLITGASGGFGVEFARLCAADGRNLVLVARRDDKLKQLAGELGDDITIHTIAQDLSEPGAAQKVYKKLRRLRITIDQLINNAGSGDYALFARAVPGRQERMIGLNITSLALLTNLLLPAMVQRGQGRILNVGSTLSFVPMPRMSVYAATKAFVLSFSEALNAELQGTGVTVTCLCPGPAKTSFGRSARLTSTHPIAKGRMSPRAIAGFGYHAMQSGVPIAIPGLTQKLFVILAKLLPRTTTRRFMLSYSAR